MFAAFSVPLFRDDILLRPVPIRFSVDVRILYIAFFYLILLKLAFELSLIRLLYSAHSRWVDITTELYL